MTPLPSSEPSKWKALLLAALVHVLLIAALFIGVQWKRQAPSAVEVEVWRAAPTPNTRPPVKVAPRPLPKPEPTPEPKPLPKPAVSKPPVKPDIALKDEKKPKEAPPKVEPKKPEEARRPNFDDELKREQKELQERKVEQDQRARAEAEARQLKQLQAEQASTARARGLADYAAKVRGKIRGNIVLPPGIQGNPEAIFEVTQLPSGEVLDVKIRQSSGNALLDSKIEGAIRKSSPLPKPDQPELFERVLRIPYRPYEE